MVQEGLEVIGLTGSTGVIGQHFLKLVNKDRKTKVECYPSRIENLDSLHSWIKKLKPHALIHLAAMTSTEQCEREPARAIQINALGTANLLQSVRTLVPRCWVFVASTSHVYSSSQRPIKENAVLKPISFYGFTKKLQDQIALEFAEKWKLRICIGRIFSSTGKGQNLNYFFPSLISTILHAQENAALKFRGGGNVRDFLDVQEAAACIYKLFKKKYCGAVNICTGKGIKIEDAIRNAAKILNRNDLILRIKKDPKPSRIVGNPQILAKIIGQQPNFNLKKMIRFLAGEL